MKTHLFTSDPWHLQVDLAIRQEDAPEGHLLELNDVSEDLLSLMQSQEWITSQYDSQLFLNTVAGPGSNAAVLRLKHQSQEKTLAVDSQSQQMGTIDGVC